MSERARSVGLALRFSLGLILVVVLALPALQLAGSGQVSESMQLGIVLTVGGLLWLATVAVICQVVSQWPSRLVACALTAIWIALLAYYIPDLIYYDVLRPESGLS